MARQEFRNWMRFRDDVCSHAMCGNISKIHVPKIEMKLQDGTDQFMFDKWSDELVKISESVSRLLCDGFRLD